MRKYIPLLIFITLLGCNSNNNTFEIAGLLSNSNKETIYLAELTQEELVNIDSAQITEKGYFEFSGTINSPKYCIVKLADNNYITVIVKPNEKIKIKADANYLARNYLITGSEDSRLIKELNDKINRVVESIDSLSKVYKDNYYNPDREKIKNELNAKFEEIRTNTRNYTFHFIDNNPNSFATIMALYMQLTPRENVLSIKNDFEYFKKVDSVMYLKYPDAEAVKLLHEQVTDTEIRLKSEKLYHDRLNIDVIAPDIILPSPSGELLSLHSLKGKFVLLDFWASWCPPCREENPNLVANYRKYKQSGFEIFQVSLDKTKENWVKAIEDDNLNWLHVSDLGYWNSSVVKLYNIQGIPTNLLLDKEGKIIAKNLRGESLNNKLKEIFNY